MKLRLSLADKISIAVIMVGIFCIMLVYVICNSYRNFTYEHHKHSIQQLAYLEVRDQIENLKANSLDLALAIENEHDFKRDYRLRHEDDLVEHLDNQFNQYFVTAGVLKILKLYLMDTGFNLRAMSSEGIDTAAESEIICPHLAQTALNSKGVERLKMLAGSCLFKNHPAFAVIVPFGGLAPKGYLQVVTDLSYQLRTLEQSLAMPIQIRTVDNRFIYQSDNWQPTPDNSSYVNIDLPIFNDEDIKTMNITIKSDMRAFNEDTYAHRNWVMSLTFITTGLIVLLILAQLRRTAIPELAKIHKLLEKIHLHTDSEDGRLLFEQLLDQIIHLRRKAGTGFSVMILDLTRFKQVNEEYGENVGDCLLLEVENRLSKVIRGSDLISWVGTDSPGHKLLPADSKTQYRATIARLGGDEFGLLLPSAETAEQGTAVAQRVLDALDSPFHICGHSINIECKVGISIYPIHGDDEKQLIRNADKAMYQAKALNQNIFVFNKDL
jgi:GGDEF domain-containing protein